VINEHKNVQKKNDLKFSYLKFVFFFNEFSVSFKSSNFVKYHSSYQEKKLKSCLCDPKTVAKFVFLLQKKNVLFSSNKFQLFYFIAKLSLSLISAFTS